MLVSFATLLVLVLFVFPLTGKSFNFRTEACRENVISADALAKTVVRYGCKKSLSIVRVGGKVELDENTIRNITDRNRDLVYFPRIDVLIATLAKGGSTSVFETMFLGLTGSPWSIKDWGDVHNLSHQVWSSDATDLFKLPLSQQRQILTSSSPGSTLRIAVQRDPFTRLVSAYKSKATCEENRFIGNKKDHSYFVPLLRRHANLPPSDQLCMNISEFSLALDRIRLNSGTPGFVSSFRRLDIHIKPQDFFFNLIDYHLVVDVADWSDPMKMRSLLDRLPYSDKVRMRSEVLHKSSSGKQELFLSEKAAASFHRFAMLSEPGILKYLR